MLKPIHPFDAMKLRSGMPCSTRLPAIQPPPWTWITAGRDPPSSDAPLGM